MRHAQPKLTTFVGEKYFYENILEGNKNKGKKKKKKLCERKKIKNNNKKTHKKQQQKTFIYNLNFLKQ